MGLKNLTLAEDAAMAITGGTPLVYVSDSVAIQGGLHLVVPADQDYVTRRSLTAKARPAALDPKTGQYGKAKRSLCFASPFVKPNGSVVFATVRIETEFPPEMPEQDVYKMQCYASQTLPSTDLRNFWVLGSTD